MYWLTILYGRKFDGTLYMHLHQTGEHACRLKQDSFFLIIYTWHQRPTCTPFMKEFDRLNSCNTFKFQTSEKKGTYSLHGQQGDKVHGNERAGFLQKRSEG